VAVFFFFFLRNIPGVFLRTERSEFRSNELLSANDTILVFLRVFLPPLLNGLMCSTEVPSPTFARPSLIAWRRALLRAERGFICSGFVL